MVTMLNEIEVSKLLGVEVTWLRRKRLVGDGPPFIKMGKYVRYRQSDLDEWIDEQRRTNTVPVPVSAPVVRCNSGKRTSN